MEKLVPQPLVQLTLSGGQVFLADHVIEERHRIKSLPDAKISPRERQRVEKLLKVIANSGSYGVFAQFDPRSLAPGKPARVRGHGERGGLQLSNPAPGGSGGVLFPRRWQPGSRTRGAAHARDYRADGDSRRGTYLFTDRDSIAIVASRRGELVPCPCRPYKKRDGRPAIRALSWAASTRSSSAWTASTRTARGEWFSPEAREREHVREQTRDLCGYMISAKRYCLYFLDEEGRVVIRRPQSTC